MTTFQEQDTAAVTNTSAAGPGQSPALEFASAWDYAPAPESTKVEIAGTHGHFIGGKFIDSAKGGTLDTLNPANETKLSAFARGTAEDVDAAVKAAHDAQPKWAALPAKERR